MLKKVLKENGALVYSISCLGVLAIALWFGASFNSATASSSQSGSEVPAATFPANTATLGAIPDNNPATPRDVTFTVSGLGAGPPTLVTGNMTFGGAGFPLGHTWVGDINAFLIAPNGTSFTLFGRTGTTGAGAFGDSSDLIGPYNFTDAAAGTNWWAEAALQGAAIPLTAGNYRTTLGGPQPSATFSAVTNLTAAFAGVASPNGTWTMRFTDNAGGDTGGISAANLTIEAAPAVTRKKNVDFDGDSKSDYAIVRNSTPTLNGENPFYNADSIREKLRILAENPPEQGNNLTHGTNLTWFVNSSMNASHNVVGHGEPTTDFWVPSDYDGDGKADIATWRPGAPTVASFYILQSSNNTIRIEAFGQTGDDPAITGDYDGDGRSDLAVFRCPPLGGSAGQCFFFYKGSNMNPNGNITYVPFGNGVQLDFYVSPGDFDGDGKFDFCLQRTRPGTTTEGQFVLFKSGGGSVEYIDWGRNNDFIVPGDYDGDGKDDFMVSRTETIGGIAGRSYYLLTRTGVGGTGGSPFRWGVAGDVRVPGDYDGDNRTDIAIWRPSPAPSGFYVRRSSDGMLGFYQYGLNGDGAPGGWNVH